MIYLESNNLNEHIKEGKCLVDFYATWCGPCNMLNDVLVSLEDKIKIIKVDVDKFKDIAFEYKVMSIPNLVFFKDGIKKEEIIGYHNEEELIEIIDKL